jgi:hypothetical protein
MARRRKWGETVEDSDLRANGLWGGFNLGVAIVLVHGRGGLQL